jgi:hypothetical protein
LQRGGLDVDAADQNHVAQEVSKVVGGQVVEIGVVLGMGHPLALGREELDQGDIGRGDRSRDNLRHAAPPSPAG